MILARASTNPNVGAAEIDKFYVWKVARNCNGEPNCMEARVPADRLAACGTAIPEDAPVRIAFRSYVEPATKVGPADPELIYERVIVFRPKWHFVERHTSMQSILAPMRSNLT